MYTHTLSIDVNVFFSLFKSILYKHSYLSYGGCVCTRHHTSVVVDWNMYWKMLSTHWTNNDNSLLILKIPSQTGHTLYSYEKWNLEK